MFVAFHNVRFQPRTRPPPMTVLNADVHGDAPTVDRARRPRSPPTTASSVDDYVSLCGLAPLLESIDMWVSLK